jgi:phosphate-selective porin OprO and OprP
MKRGIVVMVGLLALTAATQNSQAKTLEDVLKEKGVITESDYNDIVKTSPKSAPVAYKLGSGFSFTAPDEKYQLTVGGQLQARYTYFEKDGANQASSSEWRLRRAKTLFSGYFLTKDLTFKFNQNWAQLATFNSKSTNSNTSQVLEETYVNYRIADEAQIRVGQDKIQFARQWITSSSQDQFVDNSFVTDAFRPSYDTGLGLNGSIAKGLATYSLQWLGGKGQNIPQGTTNSSYNLRLAVNPLGEMKYSESDLDQSAKPLLSLGGAYFHDTIRRSTAATTTAVNTFDNNNLNFTGTSGWLGLANNNLVFGTTENVNVNTFETDLAFKWQGLSLQSEYFWAEGVGQSTNATVISKGLYAQAGYMVVPKTVELAIRYAWMDYNQNKTDSLKSEVQGAISWFVSGHNLKVQADITKSFVQNYVDARATAHATGMEDTIFRTQAQLLF